MRIEDCRARFRHPHRREGNQTTVFQRVLQPRYDQARRPSADLAVSVTQRYVNDQQRLTQQLYEDDRQGYRHLLNPLIIRHHSLFINHPQP